jgi:adenosylcobalamin-dependent ribonucleoside-triphosphate reductase
MGLFALNLHTQEFQLDPGFLADYASRPVNWGPVGYVVYKRTYARFQDPKRPGGAFRLTPVGDSEEWWQTVARVVEGTYQIQQRHCDMSRVNWDPDKAQASAQRMYQLIFDFKFTPPGRGLWMMGTPYIREHGSAALNNCAFVSTENIDQDFSEPFIFLMDMSMLGVGVGSDTRGAGLVTIQRPVVTSETHSIPDSREGWIDATRRVLEAYVGGANLPKAWSYSEVRPAGEPIRGFGGTAAGPEPLRRLLEEELPVILEPMIGKTIDASTIVDIHNVIGKCVVSGNVRRSAEIMFGEPDDMDFLRLKDPEVAGERMAGENSWRWASNNSIFATVGMDYDLAAGFTAKAGEPGYLWLENCRDFGRMVDPPSYVDQRAMGANPCVEQTLESYELCCLVETYPAHHETVEEFEETIKYAYLYAKTVTLLPTHNERTNRVMTRNRRIGLSQSGIVQNVAKHGWRKHFEWCDRAYGVVQSWDRIYAEWLGVRPSIKTTSVKPSGTVSKLCGATAGIHYPIAEHYILRIRFSKTSPMVEQLRAAGYPVEQDVYNPATTMVAEFPVKEPYYYKAEAEVSMWEQLSAAYQMQKWWSDNQVSCTIKFDPATEGPSIASALSLFDDGLKGISFLPHDHGYAQAPQEAITAEEYERRVAQLASVTFQGETAEAVDKFCDGGACTVDFSQS